MDASSVQRFECPICLSSYEYCLPKILPCIHTVCEHCLGSLIRDGRGRKFRCPVCRAECKAPKEGTRAFKTNIYLVPDHSGKRKAETACAFCAEKTQTSTRLQCGHQLCNACAQTKATTSLPVGTDHCPVCVYEAPYSMAQEHPLLYPRLTGEAGLREAGSRMQATPTSPISPAQSPFSYLPAHYSAPTRPAPPVPPSVLPQQYSDPPVPWPPIRDPLGEPPRLPMRPVTSPVTSPVSSPVTPSAPVMEDCEGEEGYDTFKGIQDPLQGEVWYVGEISRNQSNEILRSTGPEGNFLVRKTIRGDPSHIYSLDILYGGNDFHLKIKLRSDGRFYLKNDYDIPKHFDDVRSLIEFYKRETILIQEGKTGRDINVTLKSASV